MTESLLILIEKFNDLDKKLTRPPKDAIEALDAALSHIPQASTWTVSRKLYHYINPTANHAPLCPTCLSQILRWGERSRQYKKYCSGSCVSKSVEIRQAKKLYNKTESGRAKIDERMRKSSETMMKKYGTSSFFETEQFRTKHTPFNGGKGNVDALNEYRNSPNYVHPMKDQRVKTKVLNSKILKLGLDGVYDADTLKTFIQTRHLIQNKTLTQISSETGVPVTTLSKYADKLEIPIKSLFVSYEQKQISEFLLRHGIHHEQNVRNVISGELDIFIPDLNIAMEYCGLYWHSELYKDNNYHQLKYKKCKDLNIRLVTIFQNEWCHSTDIVKKKLLHILKRSNASSIYARRCSIDMVKFASIKNFLTLNHIQGAGVGGKVCATLVHDGNVVAAMVFKVSGSVALLDRYATSTKVVGGFSRLLKYSISKLKCMGVSVIESFADLRWSNGDMYEINGFVKVKELKPDYYYVKNSNLFHKFNFRHSRIRKMKGYDPNLSEHDNMLNMNIHRIYDCGKIKYEKRI